MVRGTCFSVPRSLILFRAEDTLEESPNPAEKSGLLLRG
jgi:hypothetical protein